MSRQSRQQIICLVFGIWCVQFGSLAQADDAQIQAKSKSLAHYIMANVYDLNGDGQRAVLEYQKAVKFDHRQSLPHLKLAAYQIRLGQMDEAVNQLKAAIKLQPDLSQAHYLLALVYSSQKKYSQAAVEYEYVLKFASNSNSDNIEIYSYLAQIYYSLRQYPQATNQLVQILQLQPQNVSALFLLGSIYLDSNQKEQAKEKFRKILSLEPEHDGALNSLAYVYSEENQHLDEAIKMVRKAIDIDPSNGAYYDTLGWVLYKQGYNAESLIALQKASQYVTDPIIFEHIGDVYKAVNEPTLARKFWLKSLNLDSKQPLVSQKLEQLNKTSAKNQNEESNLK